MTATPKPGQPRQCRALLLDLGGVVLSLQPGACLAHWARAAGVPVATLGERWRIDDAYKAHETGRIGFREYAASLATRLGIELTEADWLTGWNALFAGQHETVVERLALAAQRMPTCCFTNTNAEHQAVWEVRFPKAVAPFEKVYSSWQIGCRKPDVDAFRRVANDMGVAAADILFLDDSAENVAGANAAGLQALHVTSAEDTAQALDAVLGCAALGTGP